MNRSTHHIVGHLHAYRPLHQYESYVGNLAVSQRYELCFGTLAVHFEQRDCMHVLAQGKSSRHCNKKINISYLRKPIVKWANSTNDTR